MRRTTVVVICGWLLAGVAPIVQAQSSEYTFTRIADTDDDSGLAGPGCVAMNNAGTVVVAFVPAGASFQALWRGDGASFTPVAPDIEYCASINDLDEIAYIVVDRVNGGASLRRNTNGATTPIVTTSAFPYLDASSNGAYPPLSNTGNAAVVAARGPGSGPGIYVGPASGWVYNAETDPLLSFFYGPANINDKDIVAFVASRPDATVPGVSRLGIYRGSASPLIEDGTVTNAGVMSIQLARPVINNSGLVAFAGSPTGSAQIYTTSNGSVVTLVGTGWIDRFSINDSGVVAFRRGNGIYIGGAGMVDHKVIDTADALDGSTFQAGLVWEESINNHGQIAFYAFLEDGRRGVFRADPIDSTPPDVTAPTAITIDPTEAAGAKGAQSATLSAFVAGGTATDAVDPQPSRLNPQVNGSDVDNTTLFPIGTTTVTFRFQDASNNVGTDDSTVTVRQPACAVDVTSGLTATGGSARFDRKRNVYTEKVTIKGGSASIAGPVSLVLDNLSAGASLVGASGVTSCSLPTGRPYVDVDVGSDGTLTPRERITLELTFEAPAGTSVTFTPRVLAGPGQR